MCWLERGCCNYNEGIIGARWEGEYPAPYISEISLARWLLELEPLRASERENPPCLHARNIRMIATDRMQAARIATGHRWERRTCCAQGLRLTGGLATTYRWRNRRAAFRSKPHYAASNGYGDSVVVVDEANAYAEGSVLRVSLSSRCR